MIFEYEKILNIDLNKVKLLFLNSGPVSPKSGDSFVEKFKFLSQYISGYIITPVSGNKHLTVKRIGAFELHTFLYYYGNSFVRSISSLYLTFKKAYEIYIKKEKYDVVISKNLFADWLNCCSDCEINSKKICYRNKRRFHICI